MSAFVWLATLKYRTRKRLLPSLFSLWKLSATFSASAGGALDVLVPRANIDWSLLNGTAPNATVGDLNLLVDAAVVQISNPREDSPVIPEAMIEEADAGTCCAPDEFRASKSKCQNFDLALGCGL
ncbi:hypothetical protein PINS_up021712 [Pythium insidiosum]|nr:hypothetical protein PINS_up021712 [Pythium insidiosum]